MRTCVKCGVKAGDLRKTAEGGLRVVVLTRWKTGEIVQVYCQWCLPVERKEKTP